MTPAARHPGLASALLLHAAGLTSDTAAAELICAHCTWLARAEFVTGYIGTGTRHDGHPYAYIDWEHAITALDNHQLSCAPSEAAILRIAASLGRPPHSRPPRPRPGQPRPRQHRPGHHGHHPRERITGNPVTTTTTRAPPGPADTIGGAFPITRNAHPA